MAPDTMVLASSAGHELVVLGAAFLLAAVLARGGRRIGLPTIPLFMAAGILVGPNTPGLVLFEHPDDLELLAAFGLIFLLFYLGLEFSRRRPDRRWRRLLGVGRRLPRAQHRRRARLRLRPRLGHAGGVRDRRRDRHLVVGDRHQAARRAAAPRQPGDPADPRASSSSRTCSWPSTSPPWPRCSARPTRPAEAVAAVLPGARLPRSRSAWSPASAAPVVEPADATPRRRAAHGVASSASPLLVAGRGRRARRVRRHRRLHGRPDPGRHRAGPADRAAGAAAARRVRRHVLLRLRPLDRSGRRCAAWPGRSPPPSP